MPNRTFKTPKNLDNNSKYNLASQTNKLLEKVKNSAIPLDLKENVNELLLNINRAIEFGTYTIEYEQTSKYVDWLVSLPWDKVSKDNYDLRKAREILNKNHYGLEEIKERVLEYLSVLSLQSKSENSPSRSLVLCFVGLPGSGKTSFASSIAESLGRALLRIPMGGMSSALQLRGQPKTFPQAEPGLIVKGLRRANFKNPVILLDEIDSTAGGAESEVMGVLLELLDPEQNFAFTDLYINHPFDLSKAIFICTANRQGNLTAAVLDRLEMIIMPHYSDEDKICIARDYLLPRQLKLVSLPENVISFSSDVWIKVIKPFGYEIDIRAIERTINGILRRAAKKYILGELRSVKITADNLKTFLPNW